MLDFEKALRILGVKRDCNAAQVRWRFLILAKRLHPDKSGLNLAKNEEFLKVREAYDYLIANLKDRSNFNLDSTNSKFNGFTEIIESSELEHNPDTKSCSYLCRCGNITEIQNINIPEKGNYNFICQGCSLGYRIAFDYAIN